jgi:methylmalonyl-CoA mutase cobalamin-binding domain/chain
MAVVTPSPVARVAVSGSRRILTAVPLCDGHDSAIATINLELVRHGWEVIYLGYHQAASAIARAAVQEDVQAIGLSSYNGGHVVFFREVLSQLRRRGAGDVPLFGGGGGTITPADARVMRRAGVSQVFFAGTPLDDMMATITRDYTRTWRPDRSLTGDRALARAITLAETAPGRKDSAGAGRRPPRDGVTPGARRGFTVGVAGPGGAGKSTLIDELVSRFLRRQSDGRVAVVANDPSYPNGGGALLGDRVSAIHAQDDRVFFRSLATRGSATGISAAVPAVLELLRRSGEFDLILVESVGIGQESDPFGVFGRRPAAVDAVLFVLAPHYGGRIQLQKIPLLEGADWIVLNKADDPRAVTARTELTARLAGSRKSPPLYTTVAARHDDAGVDALFAALLPRFGSAAAADKRAPAPRGGKPRPTRRGRLP